MQSYSISYTDSQGATGSTGPFYIETSTHLAQGERGVEGADVYADKAGWAFDPSRVVITGPDVAPMTFSVIIWRRTG